MLFQDGQVTSRAARFVRSSELRFSPPNWNACNMQSNCKSRLTGFQEFSAESYIGLAHFTFLLQFRALLGNLGFVTFKDRFQLSALLS